MDITCQIHILLQFCKKIRDILNKYKIMPNAEAGLISPLISRRFLALMSQA